MTWLDTQTQKRLGFTAGVPVGSTVWRLLTRLEDTLLGTVLAGWLQTRTLAEVPTPRRYRTMIAIDGKTLRGSRIGDGRQVHLLSALDTTTGIGFAQVTVDTKSNRSRRRGHRSWSAPARTGEGQPADPVQADERTSLGAGPGR